MPTSRNRPTRGFLSSTALPLVDPTHYDCGQRQQTPLEARQGDVGIDSNRLTGALIFASSQGLRISQERQKIRYDELEERSNSSLRDLDKKLNDLDKQHIALVEQVRVDNQKCAADIKKLVQIEDEVVQLRASDKRLTIEINLLNERLQGLENSLKHVSDAASAFVDSQDLGLLVETQIQMNLQKLEKIFRQEKAFLEVSDQLRILKDRIGAQKDQTQPKSQRKHKSTERKAVGRQPKLTTVTKDIHKTAIQTLEQTSLTPHYNLRPRSQRLMENATRSETTDRLPKTPQKTLGKPRQCVGKKSGGSHATGKTVHVRKRNAREIDMDDNTSDSLRDDSKRAKQSAPQVCLARICCESQWAYEKDSGQKSEHEFIRGFLDASAEHLDSVEKTRLMDVLTGLAHEDIRGLPVFKKGTDWSDIWECLWTIAEVPGMYLENSR